MLLHLFWLFPLIIFFLSFLWEPRRMINAYLFSFALGALLATATGFSFIKIGQYNTQLAIYFLLAVASLIPLSFILSILYLIFNGSQMMAFEGRRLVNLLSLFYGLIILLDFGLHFLTLNHHFRIYLAPLDLLLLYGTALYLSHILYSAFYNNWPIRNTPNYIVILGSGLIGEKVPPLLAQRLDKVLALYKKFAKKPMIIVSGGQGKDEQIPEAAAMADYLVEKGMVAENILIEDHSTTTFENLTFSKKLMKKDSTALVVTNSFHALRAGIYMRRVGIKGRSIGSKTALYFLPSALIRENVALFIMYWKWHILILFFLLTPFIFNIIHH